MVYWNHVQMAGKKGLAGAVLLLQYVQPFLAPALRGGWTLTHWLRLPLLRTISLAVTLSILAGTTLLSTPTPAHASFVCDSYLSTAADNPAIGDSSIDVYGAGKFTPSAACSVTQFTIYLLQTRAITATGYIYNDNGSGKPGTLLDTCSSQSMSASPVTFTCSNNTNLTSGGTYYWVITSASWPNGALFIRLAALNPSLKHALYVAAAGPSSWQGGLDDDPKFEVDGTTPPSPTSAVMDTQICVFLICFFQ